MEQLYFPTRLSDYFKVGFLATMDLVLGTSIAKASDWFFTDGGLVSSVLRSAYDSYVKKEIAVSLTNEEMVQLTAKIWLQLMVTVFMAFETRALLYSSNLEDPLGGMVFIYSTFRQPGFWSRLDYLTAAIGTRLRDIGQSKMEEKPEQN